MELTFPIPYHPSWDIRDPSKLKDFKKCKREFLFRHLLGWRSTAPQIDLIFGEAWHAAMKYLLDNDYSTKSQLKAFDCFMDSWREYFGPEEDDFEPKKSPAAAINALPQYCAANSTDHHDFEVMYTEISGTVPISRDRVLHFRMDSVLRDIANNFYFSLDHKSKGGDFTITWSNEFLLAQQTFCYTHCLYCLLPGENIKGVKYNGAAFKYLKTKGYQCSFTRSPAWKTPDQMQVWLWEVNDLINDMEYELERLSKCSENDMVLYSFPRDEGSCTKYRGCQFHDFCLSWSNPLQHAFEPPLGYEIEFWDPREKQAEVNLNLEAEL